MPIALDVSIEALALYDHLLRRDEINKPTFGISQGLFPSHLCWDDRKNQMTWQELIEAGIAVESPDYGRYSKYHYKGATP